jgi:hypothetical protein
MNDKKQQKGRVFPALFQTEGIPNCDSNMSAAGNLIASTLWVVLRLLVFAKIRASRNC